MTATEDQTADSASDNTGEKQDTRFKPGQSGNPNGRPKGARNKLTEAFIAALVEDFETNGKDVIEKVRVARPHDYLKVLASVVPKRLENEDMNPQKDVRDMTDDELNALLWKQSELLGVTEQDVADAAARRQSGKLNGGDVQS